MKNIIYFLYEILVLYVLYVIILLILKKIIVLFIVVQIFNNLNCILPFVIRNCAADAFFCEPPALAEPSSSFFCCFKEKSLIIVLIRPREIRN